jgi:hypothetical protein
MLALVVMLFAVTYIHAQQQAVSDNDIYGLMNSILGDTSLYGKKVIVLNTAARIDNDNFKAKFLGESFLKNDRSLSKADMEYMQSQMEMTNVFFWDKEKLTAARVLPANVINGVLKDAPDADEAWALFRKTYGDHYRIYSCPIFSPDKNTAAFFSMQYCGPQCDEGVAFIYHKADGKWKQMYYKRYWADGR